jgi:Flp pilus assembly protein TadD
MSSHSQYHDEDDAPRSTKTTEPKAPTDGDAIRSLERRSQLLGIGLGIATLLLVVVGVSVLMWYSQVQKTRQTEAGSRAAEVEKEATAALNEARDKAEQGRSQAQNDRLQDWQVSLNQVEEALKRADDVLKLGEPRDDLKQKVQTQRAELDQARKALEFSDQLDALRFRRPDNDKQRADLANVYAQLFKEFGIDARLLDANLSAKKILALPNRDAVIDALLDWADVPPAAAERAKLLQAAVLAEPEPNSILKKVADAEGKNDRAALIEMAKPENLEARQPRSLRRLADALYRAGAEPEAVKVLRRGQQTFPQDFWLNYTLGSVLVSRRGARDRTDALRFLTAAAALRPPNAQLYNHLGLALRLNGEIEDAVRVYNKAKEFDPRNVAILNNLGKALQLKGDIDGALGELQEAVAIDDKRLESQINLGAAWQAKGDLSAAITCFNKALAIDPNSAIAHTSLGLTLEAQGDLDGAVAAHKKALAIEPTSVQANNNLGLAQLAKGDVDDALDSFREALKYDSQDPTTFINLGTAIRNKGDLDGALRTFQTACELAPRDNVPREHLAFVMALKNDYLGAIQEYRLAVDLNPRSLGAYIGLGKALVEKGKVTEAIAALKPIATTREFEKDKQFPVLRQQYLEYFGWMDNWEDREDRVNRVKDVLDDKTRLHGADDHLAFARLCMLWKHYYIDAVRYYGDAFGIRPALADDVRQGHRFDAACAAALAGSGQGEHVSSFTELDRRRMRDRARQWLEEDLAGWAKFVGSDKPADLAQARATMLHWRLERCLSTVRNRDALEKLPDPERVQWQQFWDKVDGFVNQLRQKKETVTPKP